MKMRKYLDNSGLLHFLKKLKEYIFNNFYTKEQIENKTEKIAEIDEINIK